MGRIGTSTYDYPEVELSKTIDMVKLISTRLGGKVDNQNALAEMLGHSTTKSGGFAVKLIAAKRYGLISGRGTLTVTKLGERIAFPTNKEEEMNAIEEALNNILLFKKIKERMGLNSPEKDLFIQLINITNASRADVQKHSEKVYKLYKDATKYLIDRKDITGKKREELADTMQNATPVMPIEGGFVEFKSSNCYIRIKQNDEDALSYAEGIIQLLKKKSGKQGSNK